MHFKHDKKDVISPAEIAKTKIDRIFLFLKTLEWNRILDRTRAVGILPLTITRPLVLVITE